MQTAQLLRRKCQTHRPQQIENTVQQTVLIRGGQLEHTAGRLILNQFKPVTLGRQALVPPDPQAAVRVRLCAALRCPACSGSFFQFFQCVPDHRILPGEALKRIIGKHLRTGGLIPEPERLPVRLFNLFDKRAHRQSRIICDQLTLVGIRITPADPGRRSGSGTADQLDLLLFGKETDAADHFVHTVFIQHLKITNARLLSIEQFT